MIRPSIEQPTSISLKRIYEPATDEDGYRILVDRLWPRGVSKQAAAIDEWMKDIAPSTELRKWFGHRPDRFAQFADYYIRELRQESTCERLATKIDDLVLEQHVTLVYAAKDSEHNHANVLHKWLLSR